MENILSYIDQNKDRYLTELKELIAIPSVSTNKENTGDIRRCADWIADHMRSIGLDKIEIFPTAGHPVVYAEWLGAPGKPTVLLYGHYDVQPPEPLELWTSPPFEATIRGDKLYARGSADDKGQVFIHLKYTFEYYKGINNLISTTDYIFPSHQPCTHLKFKENADRQATITAPKTEHYNL